MNKLVTYLLLCLFGVNIFGAGAGSLVHHAAHAIQGTHTHWHTHEAALHSPHAHTHEHEAVITFLLETFDTAATTRGFKHLGLLMMGLTALLSYVNLELSLPVAFLHQASAKTVAHHTTGIDVPTPPPRYLQ